MARINGYRATCDRVAAKHLDATDVVDYMRRRRAADVSWQSILFELYDVGIVLSEQTAQAWVKEDAQS